MAADGAAFPAHWAADVVLRDGSTMHIRPIEPVDADALQRFHLRQSPESVYQRFFGARPRLSESDLAYLTRVDHQDRVALVLVSGTEIVGVGRYDRIDPTTAEVAFHVADTLQGRGLGSVLLEHLAAAARERGVRRFVADTLPGNSRMIHVFRDAGYDVRQVFDEGVVTVSFDIDPSARSLAVMAEREQHADAGSMRALLGATSVVVVVEGGDGPGPPSAIGRRVAAAVLASSFTGPVHLVGDLLRDLAAAERLRAPDAHPPVLHSALGDVDGAPDLAVLAAPPARLPGLVAAVAALGARGVVVLTAGPGGGELLRVARSAGVRLVGPESFGLVADTASGRLEASLAEAPTLSGDVGLFCHSAPAALALLAETRRRGLGVSTFLSAGDRADVSGNDVMQFWLDRPSVRVAALHLESIGNPRKFSRVARRLSERVPVVAVVPGGTEPDVPARRGAGTSRERRRMLAELLRQAGVVRAGSIAELLDVVQLLQSQPPPRGRRVAVLADSASLGSLVAEAARAEGLDPVRLVVADSAATYEAALDGWEQDDDSDALVVAHIPVLGGRDPAVAGAVAARTARAARPVLAVVQGLHGLTAELTARSPAGARTVPAFAGPQEAARALAAAVTYRSWVAADRGRPIERSGVDHRAARDLVAEQTPGAAPGAGRVLPDDVAARLLACYGIDVWPARPVATAAEAVRAARELGWPVAVKSRDEHLRHRLDLGGVRLDVAGELEVEDAVRHLARLPRRGAGPHDEAPFEVQAMAPRGVACVLQAVEDARYGPVVSFGLAGDAVELLGDLTYAVAPVTDRDVAAMVRRVRAAPRLLGHRGLPAADVAALENVLGRLAMLTDDLPDVAHVVLHPVVAAERGAAVLGARVTLGEPAHRDRARRVLQS